MQHSSSVTFVSLALTLLFVVIKSSPEPASKLLFSSKFIFPLQPWEVVETCSIIVAEPFARKWSSVKETGMPIMPVSLGNSEIS